MCGIAGFVSEKFWDDAVGHLRRMSVALAHRGPDGFGEELITGAAVQVGLAHRRLAIIDPVGGVQPMSSEDGGLSLIFNGEIYNYRELRTELQALGHRFRTTSDSEVLLAGYAQWSAGVVERLNGMFAFAIWDRRSERLLVARDRFGEKPLFFYEKDGLLVFASEVKALLQFPAVPRQVDDAAVLEYLRHRYVPAPATLFAGIQKLRPGHLAVWERGRLQKRNYYERPDLRPQATQLQGDVVEQFKEQFRASVASRMIADVPVGAFLSGGLDSSAIVATMAKLSPFPVQTFSVGFKEEQFSELGYARSVAERFGTQHSEVVVSHGDIVDLLPALVKFRDAPVAEPSDVALYLLATQASQRVKVVLTGEGADELLGGYPKHVAEYYLPIYHALPALVTDGVLPWFSRHLPYSLTRVTTALQSMGMRSFEDRMPRWFGAMGVQGMGRFAPALMAAAFAPSPALEQDRHNSSLRSVLAYDQGSWLADNLLERGDRMTMAASLEGRPPFLDHELAAFVSTVPDKWRLRKRLLREAFAGVLPPAVLTRRKVGFRVPVNQWFRTSLVDYTQDTLLSSGSWVRGYLSSAEIQGTLRAHVAGRHNHEKLIWALLTLELWHRTYFG